MKRLLFSALLVTTACGTLLSLGDEDDKPIPSSNPDGSPNTGGGAVGPDGKPITPNDSGLVVANDSGLSLIDSGKPNPIPSSCTAATCLSGKCDETTGKRCLPLVYILAAEIENPAKLAGAADFDQACTNELPLSKRQQFTVKAWVSQATRGAPQRIKGLDLPYVRPDGTRVVDKFEDFRKTTLLAAINLTYAGNRVTGDAGVWTGTTAAMAVGENCANWGSKSGVGVIGCATCTTSSWTDVATLKCNDGTARVYCVEEIN